MIEVGDKVRNNVRDLDLTVTGILDLGEGVRLLEYEHVNGGKAWIREESCKLITKGGSTC